MFSRPRSGLILWSILGCLKMGRRTPLTRKFRNRWMRRNIVRRTSYSIFLPSFSRSIWYLSRLRKTFRRRHFCMVFIRKAKVQISLLDTGFPKFILRWFVARLKLISNFRSRVQAFNNTKHQDRQVPPTSNTIIIPLWVCTDNSLPVVVQTFLKRLIFTMKWKDQNAFS